MMASEIIQSFRDAGDDLDGVLGDLKGELSNGVVHFKCDGCLAQAFEAVNQRIGEAVDAVTVLHNAVALNLIQPGAHLQRRVLLMVEERDEAGNRPLEVDVVFPERIVSVDEKCLRVRDRHLYSGGYRMITTSSYLKSPSVFAMISSYLMNVYECRNFSLSLRY